MLYRNKQSLLVIFFCFIGYLGFKYGKPIITKQFSEQSVNNVPHIEAPQQSSSTSSASITNTITRNDIRLWAYMAWRYPNKFEITVNGKPLNEKETIAITENTVTVAYEYEWVAPWQTYTQKKELVYEITPENPHLEIAFTDWEKGNPTHITVAQAKKISEKVIFCQPEKK